MKKKPFLKLRFVLWVIALTFLLTGIFKGNRQALGIGNALLIIYFTFNLIIALKCKE